MTRTELENKMAVLLGGRAAEQIVFGHLSTGAADDLQKVTDIARSMVMRYGMDATLGHVAYEAERHAYLANGPGAASDRTYSEETAREIDRAVRQMIESVFERAVALLAERRTLLESGARQLLERETITEKELRALIQPEPT